MTSAQKSEVITSLCNLLRETTQKRLKYTSNYCKTEEKIEYMKSGFYLEDNSEVEYYNTIFSQEEVDTLKRKLLKLTEEL